MNNLPRVSFRHFGIHTTDLDAMEAWYRDTLGFITSDKGVASFGNRLVFMTQDAEEHHQLVLFDGRPQELPFNPVNQISFKLDSLAALKRYFSLLKEAQTPGMVEVDHGNAWSLYFRDPEGNMLELYVDTPFYSPQPCRGPLDLDQNEAEILARTEAFCRSRPNFRSRAAWQDEIRARIAAERR